MPSILDKRASGRRQVLPTTVLTCRQQSVEGMFPLAIGRWEMHGTDDALPAVPNSISSPAAVIDRIDTHLEVKRTALNARAYRQELLASNIANADTPNYKARDIDFKAALDGALAGRREGSLGLARTSSRHMGSESGQALAVPVKYRAEFQPNVDGNTVNMDVERAAFAENAIHMEALLTFVRSDLSTLQTAMQSQ
jgi:flagellar basal-body rod protein FlgB